MDDRLQHRVSYRVCHRTTYDYSEPVALCQNFAHLLPRDTPRQSCRQSQLLISPVPAVTTTRTDYFGNLATFFAIQEPHQQLTVTANHIVDIEPTTLPTASTSPSWEEVRERLRNDRVPALLDAYQYVFDSPYIKTALSLAVYAAESFPSGRPMLEGVLDLTRRIHAEFRYDPRATTIATPILQVLNNRRGVCQDFAHLQIGCLRSLGLAARYISGYLLTRPAAGQQRLVGADASHAWVAVFIPDVGWIEVDPTNNQMASETHILLAWGRDYDDVSPIKGVILGGGHHRVVVEVDVSPV